MKNWLIALMMGLLAATGAYFYITRFAQKLKEPLYNGRYTLQINDNERARTIKIIRDRLNKGGYDFKIVEPANGLTEITIKGLKDSQAVKEMLTAPGRLEMRAAYNMGEIKASISKAYDITLAEEIARRTAAKNSGPPADSAANNIQQLVNELEKEKIKTNTVDKTDAILLMDFFKSNYTYNNSVLGFVMEKDTALLRNLLMKQEVRSLSPANFDYIYGREKLMKNSEGKDMQEKFGLYAVKWQEENHFIENDDIASANQDYDYRNMVVINLKFNRWGTSKWEKLTAANVGKPIAMIYDGQVLTAPVVDGPLTGENSVISGNFTVAKATIIANAITGKPLPAPVHMSKAAVEKQAVALSTRQLLMILLLFVSFTGLGYFILRTLKVA